MKLRRKIIAYSVSTSQRVSFDIIIERKMCVYESGQVKEDRKKIVDGVYDLLRNQLGYEIEEISLK